jgi:hypothetical protein
MTLLTIRTKLYAVVVALATKARICKWESVLSTEFLYFKKWNPARGLAIAAIQLSNTATASKSQMPISAIQK